MRCRIANAIMCVCAFVRLCAQANDGEGKQKTKDASKLPKNMRNIFTIVLVVVDLVLIRCHSPIQNYEMMKIDKIHIQLWLRRISSANPAISNNTKKCCPS